MQDVIERVELLDEGRVVRGRDEAEAMHQAVFAQRSMNRATNQLHPDLLNKAGDMHSARGQIPHQETHNTATESANITDSPR